MSKPVLPPVDKVAEKVHEEWMNTKFYQGVHSRKAEDGQELMVPFAELSERQKDMDRLVVLAVYRAIEECNDEN